MVTNHSNGFNAPIENGVPYATVSTGIKTVIATKRNSVLTYAYHSNILWQKHYHRGKATGQVVTMYALGCIMKRQHVLGIRMISSTSPRDQIELTYEDLHYTFTSVKNPETYYYWKKMLRKTTSLLIFICRSSNYMCYHVYVFLDFNSWVRSGSSNLNFCIIVVRIKARMEPDIEVRSLRHQTSEKEILRPFWPIFRGYDLRRLATRYGLLEFI